jgi:hypothetical protein
MVDNLTHELDSSHRLINELQNHNENLVSKTDYFETVIADLEEKNKKMTELINTQIFEKAQQYKDKVITRLMDKVERKSQLQSPISRRPHNQSVDSAARLQQLAKYDRPSQDLLNEQYMAVQKQLSQKQLRSYDFGDIGHQKKGRNQPRTWSTEPEQRSEMVKGQGISPLRMVPEDSPDDEDHTISPYQVRQTLKANNLNPLRTKPRMPAMETVKSEQSFGEINRVSFIM